MKNVLIVYQNIPDSTQMFLVTASDADLETLKLAHGNYINSCDDEDAEQACNAINVFLGDKNNTSEEQALEAGVDVSEIGKWAGTELPDVPVLATEYREIDMIVVTGFVL